MTDGESAITPIREAASLAGEIMKSARENEDAREAGALAAKSLNVLARSLHTMLMPLRVLNFAAEKVEVYFETRFGAELGEKLADVPPEELVEPKSFIAGPALQGIADTVDDISLRDLYLSLLAGAMDGRRAADTHPAFVDVVRQLDASEASRLPSLFSQRRITGLVDLELKKPEGDGTTTLDRHIPELFKLTSYAPQATATVTAWLDNWIRLGLVVADFDRFLSRDGAYDWVNDRPEYQFRAASLAPGEVIVIRKGLLVRTQFGENFAKALGPMEAEAEQESSITPEPSL